MKIMRGLIGILMLVLVSPVALLGFSWRATKEAWQWGQFKFEDLMDWINQ
jgi:hypothetical protein